MSEPTVFSSLTAHVLRETQVLNGQATRILASAGIADLTTLPAQSRIPFSAHSEIWTALSARDPEGVIGLEIARGVRAADLSVVGYLVKTSANVGDGIQIAVRYARLLNERSAAQIEVRPQGILLEHAPQATSGASRHYVEWLLGCYVVLIRRFSGQDWSPDEVTFAHPAPASGAALYEEIFRCPVRFGAPRNSMLVQSATLRAPLMDADPALHAILRRHADGLLDALPLRSDLLEQVEGIVRENISEGAPTVQTVARRLGLSSRTLQRRLAGEGVTYAQILDRFREQSALRLLDDERLAIHDVSTMLGFSEPKAFRRAFKRWTSKSPRSHRTERRARLATQEARGTAH